MKYCIYFTFDQQSEYLIRFLKNKLANNVAVVSFPIGPMRPHLTLGIIKNASYENMLHAFKELTQLLSLFSINLERIGTFPGSNNVIYVADCFISPFMGSTCSAYKHV
jgi:hypothetical protein